MLSDNKLHQGLILIASSLQIRHIKHITKNETNRPKKYYLLSYFSIYKFNYFRTRFYLALDEVCDPQNLGSLLRTSYCLGDAPHVITSVAVSQIVK
jgi:tRNA G18 (ribose-2'-O)-methylase SpoU